MVFRKRSVFTGRENEMYLPVELDRVRAWLAMPRRSRPFVQDAFPDLTADQREFILTGATPEETAALW